MAWGSLAMSDVAILTERLWRLTVGQRCLADWLSCFSRNAGVQASAAWEQEQARAVHAQMKDVEALSRRQKSSARDNATSKGECLQQDTRPGETLYAPLNFSAR